MRGRELQGTHWPRPSSLWQRSPGPRRTTPPPRPASPPKPSWIRSPGSYTRQPSTAGPSWTSPSCATPPGSTSASPPPSARRCGTRVLYHSETAVRTFWERDYDAVVQVLGSRSEYPGRAIAMRQGDLDWLEDLPFDGPFEPGNDRLFLGMDDEAFTAGHGRQRGSRSSIPWPPAPTRSTTSRAATRSRSRCPTDAGWWRSSSTSSRARPHRSASAESSGSSPKRVRWSGPPTA